MDIVRSATVCVVVMLGVLAAAAAALSPVGEAGAPLNETATSRVVDRTFLCTIALSPRGYPDPGVRRRTITARAGPAATLPDGSAAWSAYAAVRDKHSDAQVGFSAGPAGGRPTGNVHVAKTGCLWRRDLRIPLFRTGLPGPPTRFNKGYECVVGRRIVVRVRAVLSRPANWRSLDGDYVGVSANLVEAEVAVRTFPGRKPLAYVAVSRTGESTIAASPRCNDAW